MAANDAGVVIGNEAVWTNEPDGPEALLGMDLVRLAAERCSTAASAVDTIAQLLESHGQGGGCEEPTASNAGAPWSYHNSFLIADRTEAWVMETSDTWWAAERITNGVRNISNCLSIRTEFDKCTPGLQNYALEAGYWDGKGTLDFAAAFSSSPPPPPGRKSSGREAAGLKLLFKYAGRGGGAPFGVKDMMEILRDERSGICMCGGGFRSNGSQVTVLWPPGSNKSDIHWFTGTPDPSVSCFKPLTFESSRHGDHGVGADCSKSKLPLPLEEINDLAPALWDRGDLAARRELRKRAVELRKLEEQGVADAMLGSVNGAGKYLEMVEQEMQLPVK